MDERPFLVEATHLRRDYRSSRTWADVVRRRHTAQLHAVDDVSLTIVQGETLGLVGESGSGKSTLGRLLLRLEKPTAGEVRYRGVEIGECNTTDLRRLRQKMQIVFQDPYSSLNPQQSVGGILAEILTVHHLCPRGARAARVNELLERVGLSASYADRRPRQLSGGQRQRVGIAKALAVEPEFVVADEAVSSLDVSMQAQILNLMRRLQEELDLTYLFISHDLGVVRHMSDRIAVMYLGRVVELAGAADLFSQPLHPYTQALIAAVPSLNPDSSESRPVLEGDTTTPREMGGCRFAARCTYAMDICHVKDPELIEVKPGHSVACYLFSNPLSM